MKQGQVSSQRIINNGPTEIKELSSFFVLKRKVAIIHSVRNNLGFCQDNQKRSVRMKDNQVKLENLDCIELTLNQVRHAIAVLEGRTVGFEILLDCCQNLLRATGPFFCLRGNEEQSRHDKEGVEVDKGLLDVESFEEDSSSGYEFLSELEVLASLVEDFDKV
jgi:hypothetical protein